MNVGIRFFSFFLFYINCVTTHMVECQTAMENRHWPPLVSQIITSKFGDISWNSYS